MGFAQKKWQRKGTYKPKNHKSQSIILNQSLISLVFPKNRQCGLLETQKVQKMVNQFALKRCSNVSVPQ
jgi:hypothetical protein